MLEINKIYNMDCLDGMKLLDDNSIQLIQADPPYNFKSQGGSFCENRDYHRRINKAFGHNFHPGQYLKETLRLMDRYNAYWWCNKKLLPEYLNFAVDHDFHFNLLTWHKTNPIPLCNGTYLPDTEYCVFIHESKAYFNSQLGVLNKYKKYYCTASGNRNISEHPTPKPLWIIMVQIEISSMLEHIVLDPFMGSGTSGVACVKLKRNYIGFDSNKGYVKFANNRINNTIPDKKLCDFEMPAGAAEIHTAAKIPTSKSGGDLT